MCPRGCGGLKLLVDLGGVVCETADPVRMVVRARGAGGPAAAEWRGGRGGGGGEPGRGAEAAGRLKAEDRVKELDAGGGKPVALKYENARLEGAPAE